MNTEVSLPMASDAPNDDIAGVPQFAVLRDEPFPKEISDSGYVNKEPDQAPAGERGYQPHPRRDRGAGQGLRVLDER